MNRQDDSEPFWQDDDDWLCTVEFLPSDDLEGRVFATDMVGYLFGYDNWRMLALWHSSAILRPTRTSSFVLFRRLRTKTSSWIWFAQMRIWGATTSRTISRRRQPKRLGMLVRSSRSCLKTL
jgi:hypothetical protein